jgi:two-component SAPR family response regulator
MNLSCIVVDDEYLAIKLVEEYIRREEELTLLRKFTDSLEALAYLKENKVDLIFLDIQMPYLTGIDLMKQLENPPLVIFTTASQDYAVKAFDLEAMDYLVKPFSFERFEEAMDKVRQFRKLTR